MIYCNTCKELVVVTGDGFPIDKRELHKGIEHTWLYFSTKTMVEITKRYLNEAKEIEKSWENED